MKKKTGLSEDPCLVENTVSVFCFYRKEKDKAIMHRRSNEEKIFCIFMSNLKLVYNFFNVLIHLVLMGLSVITTVLKIYCNG